MTEFIMKKKWEIGEVKVHKMYLVMALFFGIIFSIMMPIFNEQDGQYHFAASTAIVDLPVNLSNYGEYTVGSGMGTQQNFYKNGTHFQQYYLQKVQIIPQADIPRNINSANTIFHYDFMGHVIPALGVWIGYHVYPSLGVMVVFGRLINMIVCSIMIFLIIQWMKKGKLLLATIMLSPVAINSFASLSYDAVNFVWVSFLIAFVINKVVDKKVNWKYDIPIMIGIGIVSKIWFKTNYLVLLLMFVIIIADILINKYFDDELGNKKKNIFIAVLKSTAVLISSGAFYYWTHGNGGVRYVLERLWASFGISNTSTPTLVSQSLLAQSNRGYNMLPYWIAGVWFTLIIFVLLVEGKYVKSKLVSFGALAVFIASILAVYLNFIPFNEATSGQIYGVQGRYFTPVLLLLSLFIGNEEFKLKITPKKTIFVWVLIIVFVSNMLLVVNTLSGMHGLFVEMRG